MEKNPDGARKAAGYLDEIREAVWLYPPACEAVIAHHSRSVARLPESSPARERAYDGTRTKLLRLRAAVLEVFRAASALRVEDGIRDVPQPRGDRETIRQYSLIRAAHEAYAREQSGVPADFELDEAVERHLDAIEAGRWPWKSEGGAG